MQKKNFDQDGKLQILDQLRLPHEEVFVDIESSTDAFQAIRSMQVRGAPAIAIVAALSLAVQLFYTRPEAWEPGSASADFIRRQLALLVTSRPTAVNLADAATKLTKLVIDTASEPNSTAFGVNEAYTRAAVHMLAADVQDNEKIGEMGAAWIHTNALPNSSDGKLSVLTHCNTGSLATAGYGTALGIVRSLHTRGILRRAFYTETRPYNQGSRLTGYELIHDQIPATLITDSMAATLLQVRKQADGISTIVVGADRVAANGDTANKIGTYSLAILARYHSVKFLVAAPRTTIDLNTKSGADIVIEERAAEEVTIVKGPQVKTPQAGGAAGLGDICTINIAAPGTQAWNPAFDVTPAELIDGIVTEKGVLEKESDGFFHFESIFDSESKGQHSKVINGSAEATNT